MARVPSPNGPANPAGVVRILRRAQVSDRVGLSPAQVYFLISQGSFPKPVTLSANRVGWIESEVASWLAERIAQRDEPHAGQFRRGRRPTKAAEATTTT